MARPEAARAQDSSCHGNMSDLWRDGNCQPWRVVVGGGTSETGEERHISWRVLLTVPRLPKGYTPQVAGPGKTAAGLGLG